MSQILYLILMFINLDYLFNYNNSDWQINKIMNQMIEKESFEQKDQNSCLAEQLRLEKQRYDNLKEDYDQLNQTYLNFLQKYEELEDRIGNNRKQITPEFQANHQHTIIELKSRISQLLKRNTELQMENRRLAVKVYDVDKMKKVQRKLQEQNASLQKQVQNYKKMYDKQIQNFELSQTCRTSSTAQLEHRRKWISLDKNKQVNISCQSLFKFIHFYMGKLATRESRLQFMAQLKKQVNKLEIMHIV